MRSLHLCFIGVYSSLFNRHLPLLTSSDKHELEKLVKETSAPVELASHGRQSCRPSEKAQFIATEFLNYLFFPILFKKIFENNQVQYSNLLRLSFSKRLLLTRSIRQIAKKRMRFGPFLDQDNIRRIESSGISINYYDCSVCNSDH